MRRTLKMRNAYDYWEAAVMESPRKPRAILNYASYTRREKGDCPELDGLLKVVIQTATTIEWEKACSNLARLYGERGQFEQSEEVATIGMRRKPNEPDCRLVRGVARIHLKKWNAAFEDICMALAQGEQCPTPDNAMACAAVAAYEAGLEEQYLSVMDNMMERKGLVWTARSVMEEPDPFATDRWKAYATARGIEAQGAAESHTPLPSISTPEPSKAVPAMAGVK